MSQYPYPRGATYLGQGRTAFRVWVPQAETVALHLFSPAERIVALPATGHGYFGAVIEGVEPGARYVYRLNDERERPDPASCSQPEGVHAPSEVVDQSFDWRTQDWIGIRLQDYVIYELHVGTFTPEGTFDAIIPHLPALRELGITAVEIMPVAQFPGDRNWGYDGVYPYAVQSSYGGPAGLKRLVDACHAHGLAVVLDVVYNHLGAEGNYLWDYGPYFTDRYKTGWGSAVNFDGPQSDHVRAYFVQNALYWLRDFRVDALRLDAVHAMLDFSAGTFLEELASRVEQEAQRLGRRLWLIAESDLNDPRIVRAPEAYGFGLDAQWADDLHHALHTLLTGESDGYYRDYVVPDAIGDGTSHPSAALVARALRDAYIYTGQYSLYRQRRHGARPDGIPAHRFVVAAQNHDQVGNRRLGERLTQLVPFDKLKLAAGVILLSPFVPLLFMGEEYGEPAPFQYFISHGDPQLVQAVREGRRAEFAAFGWQDEPPDPAAEATFQRSKLDHELREREPHRTLRAFYQALIELRKTLPALSTLNLDRVEALGFDSRQALSLRRWSGANQALAVFNFGDEPAQLAVPAPAGRWQKQLDSTAWTGGERRERSRAESALPEEVVSEGELLLTVPRQAMVVYAADGILAADGVDADSL